MLHIDETVQSLIPGVTFGVITINGVTVRPHDERLWSQIEALGQRLTGQYTLDGLSEYPQIAAVRGMQKSFGFDPTRYRPSSEALLRRVLKGQSLHPVNTAVDVNNLCSLEFLLPMCMYDLGHVRGQIWVRLGKAGEAYQGIGRQVFQMTNKVVLADDAGIIGNTVSDSERTKVTTDTTTMLLVICAPTGSDAQTICQYASLAGSRVVEWNGGQAGDATALIV
jgi:DNA/RNA-binding domain of Phe-tRNA-synthetase-like protein